MRCHPVSLIISSVLSYVHSSRYAKIMANTVDTAAVLNPALIAVVTHSPIGRGPPTIPNSTAKNTSREMMDTFLTAFLLTRAP